MMKDKQFVCVWDSFIYFWHPPTVDEIKVVMQAILKEHKLKHFQLPPSKRKLFVEVLHLSEASCFTSQYLGRFFFYIFISAAPSLFPFLVLPPQLLAIVNLIHRSRHSQLPLALKGRRDPLLFLAFKFHSLLSFLLSYSGLLHTRSIHPTSSSQKHNRISSLTVHVGNNKSLQ